MSAVKSTQFTIMGACLYAWMSIIQMLITQGLCISFDMGDQMVHQVFQSNPLPSFIFPVGSAQTINISQFSCHTQKGNKQQTINPARTLFGIWEEMVVIWRIFVVFNQCSGLNLDRSPLSRNLFLLPTHQERYTAHFMCLLNCVM